MRFLVLVQSMKNGAGLIDRARDELFGVPSPWRAEESERIASLEKEQASLSGHSEEWKQITAELDMARVRWRSARRREIDALVEFGEAARALGEALGKVAEVWS